MTARTLRYFGHIKHHSGLERIVLEGAVYGRRVGPTNMEVDSGH